MEDLQGIEEGRMLLSRVMDGTIVGVKSCANRNEAVVHYIIDNVRINGN